MVKETYDGVGRLCGVGASGSTCSSGTTYASGISYNPAQQVTGVNFGNGVTASFGYSADRLQMTSLSYANSSSTLFSLSYSFGSSGSNNGMITGITDNVQSGRTASYSYDALSRISAASTTGSTAYPAWALNWTYDRYGNRTSQAIPSPPPTVCTFGCPTDSLAASATTNRITNTGFSYDASGNMTSDAYNTLVYDAENRAVSASNSSSSGAYVYDGNGVRVKKSVPMSSPTTTTVYIFSGTRVIAEYVNGASVGAPTHEYLYAGNILLATVNSSVTTYHHSDHLSPRLSTDSSGNSAGEQGHFPFGESWYSSGTTTKYQFTNYERDAESGNDYAMARSYANRLGRFTSPDLLAGSTSDPQSLNRFSYSRNDPVNRFDPSGMSEMFVCDHYVNPETGKLGPPVNCGYVDSGGYDDDPNADPCIDWGEFVFNGGCGGGGGTGGPTAAIGAAQEMIKKPDCNSFLNKVLDTAQQTSSMIPQLQQQMEKEISSDIYSALSNAKYIGLSNQFAPNNGDTQAVADYKPSPGQSTITLYKPFFDLIFTNQRAQVLVHEDAHLAGRNVSDIQLAQAAIPGYTPDPKARPTAQRDAASIAFNEELKKHCN